jgi:hypothetical protein
MDENIAIRMTKGALLKGNGQAAQYQRAALH